MNEVDEIMLEHLKLLAEAAEECDEKNLGIITNAMVSTAYYLTGQKNPQDGRSRTDSNRGIEKREFYSC